MLMKLTPFQRFFSRRRDLHLHNEDNREAISGDDDEADLEAVAVEAADDGIDKEKQIL